MNEELFSLSLLKNIKIDLASFLPNVVQVFITSIRNIITKIFHITYATGVSTRPSENGSLIPFNASIMSFLLRNFKKTSSQHQRGIRRRIKKRVFVKIVIIFT